MQGFLRESFCTSYFRADKISFQERLVRAGERRKGGSKLSKYRCGCRRGARGKDAAARIVPLRSAAAPGSGRAAGNVALPAVPR